MRKEKLCADSFPTGRNLLRRTFTGMLLLLALCGSLWATTPPGSQDFDLNAPAVGQIDLQMAPGFQGEATAVLLSGGMILQVTVDDPGATNWQAEFQPTQDPDGLWHYHVIVRDDGGDVIVEIDCF